MKIVALHSRRKHLYGIEFDCAIEPKDYGATADSTGLIAIDRVICDSYHLCSGLELDDATLREIVEASHCSRAKSRALWYLEQSDCSKKQLIEKLRRNFPEAAAIYAADKMEELGFIDDRRYAERLAKNYVTQKRVAPKKAAFLMSSKGIDRDLAKEIAEDVETDSVEVIKELINKKYRNSLGDEKSLNRTVAALARRGFSFSDIRTAIRLYNNEIELFEE